jgi:Holliday junction resolvase RusA-like endonuclease
MGLDYLLSFTVYGTPGPQGSKTATGRMRPTKNGKLTPVLRESSAKVKPWRAAVRSAAEAAVLDHPHRPWFPLDGPLVAHVVFTVRAPQRKKPDEAPAADRTPDISKLLRSTEDALKDVAWTDDARVVGYDLLWKTYPTVGAHSLPQPGARIRIRRATATDLCLVEGTLDWAKYATLLDKWSSVTTADRRTAALAAYLKGA